MKRLLIKYTLPLVCIWGIMSFTSCEKEIDVELRSIEPLVVVEALLQMDKTAQVNITTTKDFSSNNDFLPMSGAVVTLSDNEGNSEVLQQSSDGLYVGKRIRGELRKTYYLRIKIGEKEYTSVSTMPQQVKLQKINMYPIPTFGYPVPQIVFQDPNGEDNYYRAKLYVNGVRMDIGGETVDDFSRDGILIERVLPVFDNDKESSRKLVKGDTVFVEFQSLDKGAFDFFNTYGQMGNSLNNPTSNIQGGALGYFSTYAVDYKQIIADWD